MANYRDTCYYVLTLAISIFRFVLHLGPLAMNPSHTESMSAKPDKFDGKNFKRWQNQMRFWLTTLGLVSVIGSTTTEESDGSHPTHEAPPNNPRRARNHNVQTPQAEAPSTSTSTTSRSPQEIDFHCLHRILSVLSDRLYDIHYTAKSVTELWVTLENKYGMDDAGLKRFKAADFHKFKFVDTKPMNEQIHEFENLVADLKTDDTDLSESFLVASLIEKLPSSWVEFGRILSHTQGDLALPYVLISLRIEEQHRLRDKPTSEPKPKINLVENPKKPKFQKKNQSHNRKPHQNKRFKKKKLFQGNFKKKEEDGVRRCFVCGRTGHLARDCYHKHTGPPNQRKIGPPTSAPRPQANMMTGGTASDGFRNRVEEL